MTDGPHLMTRPCPERCSGVHHSHVHKRHQWRCVRWQCFAGRPSTCIYKSNKLPLAEFEPALIETVGFCLSLCKSKQRENLLVKMD